LYPKSICFWRISRRRGSSSSDLDDTNVPCFFAARASSSSSSSSLKKASSSAMETIWSSASSSASSPARGGRGGSRAPCWGPRVGSFRNRLVGRSSAARSRERARREPPPRRSSRPGRRSPLFQSHRLLEDRPPSSRRRSKSRERSLRRGASPPRACVSRERSAICSPISSRPARVTLWEPLSKQRRFVGTQFRVPRILCFALAPASDLRARGGACLTLGGDGRARVRRRRYLLRGG